MNKKIFGFTLIIFVVLAVLAAGRTLAVNLSFNNLTYDQPTLRLKNSTQGTSAWTSPVSANPGDVIRFLVYYHCGGSETYPSTDQALNTKIRLTIPTALETRITANGRIWADNAAEATGIAEINISSAQKLIFQNTAIWYRNQISSDISINTGNGYAEANIGNILCDPNDSYGNAGFVIFTANINNPPVANAGTDKDIFEGQTTVLDGSGFDLDNNPLTYLWTCDGGSLSDNQIAKPIFTPPAITQDTTYNCTLRVTDIHGSNHSDAMKVLVRKHTFSVNLSANPVSGTAPLNGVSFTAQVSGTATGLMNYIFYCNRNDAGTNITPGWAHRVDAINTNPLAANNICNYTASGAYTAKVIVERAGIAAEKRITINVEEPLVFNAMTDDQEVLRLKNQTKNTPEWIDTISAEPNDIIRFNVYYHCGVNSTTAPTQQARNTRIRISTADALQTKITPNVRISADNAFEKNDGSTINVSSSQKLIFDRTAKWYHAGAIDDIQVETGGDPYTEANLGNINADTLGRFDNAGFVIFTATVSNVFANHPPVANAGPDKDVFEAQSVILPGSGTDVDGDTLTYSWSCASGSLSNPLIAQPTYMAPLVNTDTDYICTLTVNDGKGGQASDATKITVKNQTLAVSLTANPASGNAPLTGVDLTADISGTAIGAINYIFYCNRADSGTNVTSGWARQIEGTNVDPFTANDVCNYTVSGTYTAKVIVERGTAAAEDRIVINVSQPSNNLPLVSAGPDKEVFENQVVVLQGSASDPDGDSLTYSWNCTGGSLSNSQTPQPTYLAPAVTSDTDYTCTFTATDSRNGSASDNVLVKVKNQTLSVSLTANPASGTAPLFGVDLTADVSGTAPGTINYIFYCNRSDSGTNVTSGWAFRQDGTNTDPLTANDVCDYTSSGSYTAKVIAERGALSAEARATITVSGNTVPTVDLKANGFDGPITIPYNASANLSWQSNNATSCTASGAWSGNKPLSGSQSTGNLTSSKTYTITCSRDSLTIIDSVTINVESTDPNHPPVANAGPDKEVIEEQTVVLQGSGTDPDNDSLSYVWACNGGTLSDNHISQPVFTAPTVNADTTYVCNLTVNDNRGASNSDSMNVMVRNRNSSLTVSLSANPASGNAPLNDIDLTADVSGTAEGTINYIFYCNRADSGTNVTSGWAFRQDGTNTDPLTANDVCDYTSSGSYTAKVIAERGALSAEARATITVSGNTVPTVDLKANGFDGPITIPYNASANLSWQSNNATSCTASNAWSGAKAAAGSENTGSLTSSRIYTLICYGAGGSASDSVVVNVTGTGNNSPIANAGPDKTVYSGQTVILEGSGSDPDNDAITYSWYCNGGTLSASYVNQPVFTAPYVNSDTVYTCILTVNDNRGASNSDSMNVTVRSQGLSVGSFTANPSSGNAPLNGVDFTVDVIGASGPINYIFYCNRTDSGTNITSGWNYRLDSSNYDPLSVNDVCNYSTPGIYNAKVIVERSSMAAEARVTINVSGNVAPSVDIKANGFDGPITIPNNASANLSWQSTNAASCTATNGWTGTKATSGSENTGNLITSKTYTLTCSGTGGSASDSVVVNAEASKNLLATINVRNITDNTVLAKSVNADPTEKIEISIQVSGVNQTVPAVTVRASLPSRMNYEGNLKIDGAANSGNILSGISLGDLAAGQTKTITFEASVGNETQFNFGVNNLIATMIAYNTSTAITDSATIVVTRRAVAGAATGVSTGITDSLVNYLLIPGALATALVWLLRRNLLFVEEWWDKRKTAMFHLKTERDLQNKISRIRIQEHFQD